MLTSRERILVTHVGSLPRNEELSDLLVRREEGEAIDKDRLAQAMDRGVRHVVPGNQPLEGVGASWGRGGPAHGLLRAVPVAGCGVLARLV